MNDDEIITQIDKYQEGKKPKRHKGELCDEPLPKITRPLTLIGNYGYLATWVPVKYDENATELSLAILRDDGSLFTDADIEQRNGDLSQLAIPINLPEIPESNLLLSSGGVKSYIQGEKPDPFVVFNELTHAVDHFMDFDRSLADQQIMSRFVACYILATYLLDAFGVVGYLWSNGEAGSGKTHLLLVLSRLCYLGQFILAGGSFAAIRDMAAYGATLCFDDCEKIMDYRKGDPDKQSLLLAGNRKGATVTLKEQIGKQWVTKRIHAYCPRAFSAIQLPNDVLSSRTIVVPLISSADPKRSNSDPMSDEEWPIKRGELIDDLWLLGLSHLKDMVGYDKQAANKAPLHGRAFQPWRSIYSVALWLTDHGITDIDRDIANLMQSYQKERVDIEPTGLRRVAIVQLLDMANGQDYFKFTASDLAKRINQYAVEQDLVGVDFKTKEPLNFTNSYRVGKLLGRLRIEKKRGPNKREWIIKQSELLKEARSLGLSHDTMTLNDTCDTSIEGLNDNNDTVNPLLHPSKQVSHASEASHVSQKNVSCEFCSNYDGVKCQDGCTVSKNPLEERRCSHFVNAL